MNLWGRHFDGDRDSRIDLERRRGFANERREIHRATVHIIEHGMTVVPGAQATMVVAREMEMDGVRGVMSGVVIVGVKMQSEPHEGGCGQQPH